jgi:hypothetical protein
MTCIETTDSHRISVCNSPSIMKTEDVFQTCCYNDAQKLFQHETIGISRTLCDPDDIFFGQLGEDSARIRKGVS